MHAFVSARLVAQLCLTLCDPMDCSPSASSVHGILQARILEWVTVPSSREIFSTQGWNGFSCVSCIGKRVLYNQCHLGASIVLLVCQNPYSEASTAFRIMSKFLNLTRSETPHQPSLISPCCQPCLVLQCEEVPTIPPKECTFLPLSLRKYSWCWKYLSALLYYSSYI